MLTIPSGILGLGGPHILTHCRQIPALVGTLAVVRRALSLVSSAKNTEKNSHSNHVSFLPVLLLRTLVQTLLKICAWAEQVILDIYCSEELRFRPSCVLLQAAVGR